MDETKHEIGKSAKNQSRRQIQQPDTSDTLSSHAGNPQQFDWLLRRVLDPTAQKMRLGGGYDWKAEMEDWGRSSLA
ncbi:hypothetical protein Tco_1307183 [Tanacetum coccineum]